jgi:hypothetical protein
LNDKNRLNKKQEDLIQSNMINVEVEKTLALEKKKNELLSAELSSCHDSISSIKIAVDLNARI